MRKENRLPLLAGVSAGGMYPFHSGLTNSTPGYYRVLKCMEWLKHSFCAHSDSKKQASCDFDNNKTSTRFSAYQAAIKLGKLPAGYAVPDHCMLHFYNDNLIRSYSTNNTKCHYITPDCAREIETIHLTKDNTLQNAKDALFGLGLLSLKSHGVTS